MESTTTLKLSNKYPYTATVTVLSIPGIRITKPTIGKLTNSSIYVAAPIYDLRLL